MKYLTLTIFFALAMIFVSACSDQATDNSGNNTESKKHQHITIKSKGPTHLTNIKDVLPTTKRNV